MDKAAGCFHNVPRRPLRAPLAGASGACGRAVVFASPIFLFLFLPVVLAVHFAVPARLRNALLLLASLFFYAWGEHKYLGVIFASITVNYLFGLGIGMARSAERPVIAPGRLLAACVVVNLGMLAWFKYSVFVVSNVNALIAGWSLPPLPLHEITLPLGISFFTFQAMSYVLDVYRGQTPVQRNPVNLALFVAFFPQLIAGPIVRYHDIAAQIMRRELTSRRFSLGIQRFIFGLAKKVVIANTLGETADKIFALDADGITPGMAWLGIACYTLQIYYDFSGYSDMAIGLGRMFGFEFLENFHFPYISRSITEFWRRWHISLSSWFRDYLYIPLGGSRVSPRRTYLNLWIVFLLCGLWHGANWTFLAWGAFHGLFLVIERAGFSAVLERLGSPLRHVYTMLLVVVGWVLFRSDTLAHAGGYLARMAGFLPDTGGGNGAMYDLFYFCDPATVLTLLIGCVFATPLGSVFSARMDAAAVSASSPVVRALAGGAYFLVLIALLGFSAAHLAAGTYNPFIYYRF